MPTFLPSGQRDKTQSSTLHFCVIEDAQHTHGRSKMALNTSIVQTKDTPALGPPHPLYSNITVAQLSQFTSLITIAGQVATRADGTAPKSLTEQVDHCLSKLSHCLGEAGATVHDLTKLTYYITERAWEEEDAMKVLLRHVEPWLEGHRPASSLLVVRRLSRPEFLCEFEGQAVVRRAEEARLEDP